MRLFCHGVVAAIWLLAHQSLCGQDAGGSPLPNTADVLKRVVERAEKEDDERAFKQHYTYHRSRVKETRNGKGELKRREEKQTFHVPKPGADDDNPNELEIEDRDSGSGTNLLKSGKGRAFDKSDFALTDELLGRFEFTVVARETIGGRTALVIEFEPASGELPEKSIKDKFINRAAGRIWVDEQEDAVVKAEFHLTERVNIGGGVVGAVWKFTFAFTRERTEEGYWFARRSQWHMEGRQVFLKRIMDYHDEKSDVKKYQAPAPSPDASRLSKNEK